MQNRTMRKTGRKVTRRSFINTTLSGVGAVALGSHLEPFVKTEKIKAAPSNGKWLMATTDYIDNVEINNRGSRYGTPVNRSSGYYDGFKCFMDRSQLDGLHKALVSLGVSRHQWIVDTMWTLYDSYPHSFDLLAEAANSAHVHGLKFFAEIKLFEGGGMGMILPHSMPYPDGVVAFRDLRGIFPVATPFAVKNPELNLKRRDGTFKCSEPVSAIRIVKGDDRPTRVKAKDLLLWTSTANNRFVPYNGPVSFRETIETRYRFPNYRKCRILHLEGLKIPDGHEYFLIRCPLADAKGDFSNQMGNIIELAGPGGKIMPHTMSTGPVSLDDHYASLYKSETKKHLIRYLQLPEVQAEISDRKKMEEHYRDFYSFGEFSLTDWVTFDKEGFLAAACGKPEYIPGHLNPVYPEVREHWLGLIRFCLDRGVDGINLRLSSHTLFSESWEYGFNEPVLRETGGKIDFSSVSHVNGEAFTLFLHEAGELIKSRGKSLTLHLETCLLMPDDRPGKDSSFPYNFEWQWEKWVKEIGDDFEIRGVYQLLPWNLKKAVDIFSTATLAANKPLYLQGDFHGMTFDGPFESAKAETDMVDRHEGLDGYVYYETANITRLNDNGDVELCPGIIDVLSKHTYNKITK